MQPIGITISSVTELNTYYDSLVQKAKEPQHLFNIEKARAIALAYAMYYANDGYETAGIEIPFCLPFIDPETEEPMEGVSYGGIIDAIVRRKGLLFFCDHKTTKQVDWAYWQELKTNPQLTQYSLAARQAGIQIDGFLWDVIVKPTISPKKLTKAAKEEIEEYGTYCSQPLRESYRGEEEETPSLYGLRVFVAYTENPEKFFQRRILTRTDDNLLEYLEETTTTIKEIARCKASPNLFTRSLNACKSYGTLCEYHQLCADKDESRYQPIPDRPKEKDPDSIMKSGSYSPSRLGAFQLCRRKFKHRYIDKIESKRKEYVDATEFGTLFHSGMEVFLQSRLVPEDQRVKFPTGD